MWKRCSGVSRWYLQGTKPCLWRESETGVFLHQSVHCLVVGSNCNCKKKSINYKPVLEARLAFMLGITVTYILEALRK